MAKFEVDGIDDVLADFDYFDIECPECGSQFSVKLSDIGSVVTCPRC